METGYLWLAVKELGRRTRVCSEELTVECTRSWMIWHFRLADAWPSEFGPFRGQSVPLRLRKRPPSSSNFYEHDWGIQLVGVDFSYGGNGVDLQLWVFWGAIWGMWGSCRGRSFSWWDQRSHRRLLLTSRLARAGMNDLILFNKLTEMPLVAWTSTCKTRTRCDVGRWVAARQVKGNRTRPTVSSQLDSFKNM